MFYVDLFIQCGLILEKSYKFLFSTLQVKKKKENSLLGVVVASIAPSSSAAFAARFSETSINLIFDNEVDITEFEEICIDDTLI